MASRAGGRVPVRAAIGALALVVAVAIWVAGAPRADAAGGTGKTSKAAAVAMGRQELIKVTALPGEWTLSPFVTSAGTGARGSGGAIPKACQALVKSNIDQSPPVVESPYFDQKGGTAEIQEEIDIYPSARQAARVLALNGTSALQQCFAQAFNADRTAIASSVGQGATVGTMTAQAAPIATYGQGAEDTRLVIPITYNGTSFNLYYDNVVIVKGRSQAVIEESNLSEPIATSLAAAVDQAVASKL
jgi:hypothetical protein